MGLLSFLRKKFTVQPTAQVESAKDELENIAEPTDELAESPDNITFEFDFSEVSEQGNDTPPILPENEIGENPKGRRKRGEKNERFN